MMKREKTVNKVIFIVIIILGLFHSIPILMILMNALRTNESLKKYLFAVPAEPQFKNFVHVWVKGGYSNAYISSVIIGSFTVISVLFVVTLAAYGITKLDTYFKKFFTGYFVSSLTIPAFGIIIPLFFMFNKLKLVDSRMGMIIIYSALNIPFNFLFMRAFFIGMPKALEEAARIDGCSELETIRYITLPLAKPIMSTVALIVFTSSWNEFLFANTFLSTEQFRTVSLRFFKFSWEHGNDLAYIYSAACIAIIPIVVLYLFLQDSFIEGMTKGGIKA